jgi:hypothetical protein
MVKPVSNRFAGRKIFDMYVGNGASLLADKYSRFDFGHPNDALQFLARPPANFTAAAAVLTVADGVSRMCVKYALNMYACLFAKTV